MDFTRLAILSILAYLIGAIPTGLIIGKLNGVDLREHGSGKTGATNVSRLVGRRAALLVFVLDAAKGALPVAIARLVGWGGNADAEAVAIGCTAFAALAGHIWSVWIRIWAGKWGGGRGVSTAVGTMLMVNPLTALFGLAVAVPVILISRYVSLGSIIGIIAGGLLMITLVAFAHYSIWLAVYVVVAGGLVVLIHHDNIERLLKGTERKLSFKSRQGQ
ncbi:MAG: glycerol-3-phosphate 1-O-acyltransferase PlsY [Chloroflexia bacterium]